jgi:hypothetical protein
VAQDGRVGHADRRQQAVRVGGKLLEAVLVVLGFARLAKADLVGCDHAVAGAGQFVDRGLPGRGAEVLAVQENHGAAVRLRRFDVHVGHVQRHALRGEAVLLDRVGIIEAFELGAVAGLSGGGLRGRLRVGGPEGKTQD